MDELLAMLHSLGATVEVDYPGTMFPKINGVMIGVNVITPKRGGKCVYEMGDRKFTSVKNAAHFILTDHLPIKRQQQEMEEAVAKATKGSGFSENVFMFGNSIRLTVDNLDDLRSTLRYLAERV